MKKYLRYIAWLVVAVLGLRLVSIAIPYFWSPSDYEFLLVKQDMLHNIVWKIAFYVHLAGGALAILTGMSLFFTKWIRPSSPLHKTIGRIYFIAIMFFAGPTGLYLGFYAEAGWIASIGFIGMSLAWMIPTFMSVYYIARKNVSAHYKWTIRSYAMTLAGVTLRIMTPLGIYYLEWGYDLTFIITAFIPWMMNLCIAEIIIFSRRNRMSEIVQLGKIAE